MSFDLIQRARLQQLGGKLWEHYEQLVIQADASAYDSPAAVALAEFQRDWCNDPLMVQQQIAAAAEAAKTEA